ncbi:hypothetical protein DDB_G0289909 [Dictyostelium discoideum AX4]|uniref:V-SNARE coiled-coil homology domain-containing protein n=1 Tax=Dictyostelium discoideum TaxID=44689 RepID=Q54GV1_DICDI|nr:hypothetical protein DDB_G0289909 [Dictyostelium discoideum AX4]EAL62467.1 hypothetical protein DDB_G0289909 [Dictyostelium discoideum AX4]|eukprot:XP_635968.1 hypothetical protein DDB_G0289909 [Dictyostelium discoideum AX4]
MSIFNKIKKFIKDEDEDEEDIFKKPATPNKTPNKQDINEFGKNIFINGINGTKSALAFDNVLNLCAIGFNDGSFKIFGKNGYEIPLKAHTKSMIKKIYFIINSPFIIIVTDSSIEKWDYDRMKLNNILLYKTRITSICQSNGLKHLFFSTEDSMIQTYNIHNNFLSSYQLYDYEHNGQTSQQQQPEFDVKCNESIALPSCLKVNPINANQLLVGYNNGLILIFNLESKKIEKRIESFIKCGYCTSICWSRNGSKFVAGFLNGEIHLIKYSTQNSTSILIYKSQQQQQSQQSQQSQQQQYYPIDQLEILYTNNKKLILFKGVNNIDNIKSLILIKGDNFKNVNHLSSVQVFSNLLSYCPITTLPYYNNNGFVESLLLIESNGSNRLLELKIDQKTLFFSNPISCDEINLKSFSCNSSNNKVKLMKSYQCDSKTIDLIYQLFESNNNMKSSINGGPETLTLNKLPGVSSLPFQQLMITVHYDNTIEFWNSSDPKNILYLGTLNINNNNNNNSVTTTTKTIEIITISFSVSNLLLTISTSSSELLIYHISDFSKRIDTLIYNNNSNNNNNNSNNNNTEQNQQQEEDGIKEDKQLPNAVFDVFKLMGKIIMGNGENITSITLNPYKSSYSTRILIGTDLGNVYHYIVSIVNNKEVGVDGVPTIPSSQVVYTLAVFSFGNCSTTTTTTTTTSISTTPSSNNVSTTTPSTVIGDSTISAAITSISLCFYPIRNSDIDSSIVYLGTSDANIMVLDLQTMKIISSFKLSNSGSGVQVGSLLFTNKRGDPIQFLFFGSINHDDAESIENLNDISTLSKIFNNDLLNSTGINGSGNGSGGGGGGGEEFKSMIEEISLIVSTIKEISIYSVSFGSNKIIQHKRLNKHDGSNKYFIDGLVHLSTQSDGKPVLISLDASTSSIELYNTINLDKLKSNSLLPIIRLPTLCSSSSSSSSSLNNNIIKFIITPSYSNGYLYIDNNNSSLLYCISNNGGHQLNQYPTLFVDNIPMPPLPKGKSKFTSFFSSKPSQQTTESNLDRIFSEDGNKIPTPSHSQQIAGISDLLNKAKEALEKRGDQLKELELKTSEMEMSSRAFSQMAKQLSKK